MHEHCLFIRIHPSRAGALIGLEVWDEVHFTGLISPDSDSYQKPPIPLTVELWVEVKQQVTLPIHDVPTLIRLITAATMGMLT